MAESFWKSLGSKLVETGAAYLQQVNVVNELKQLSPEEARARFAKYVAGLSAAARSGFAVTLTAMANSETSAEARRFLESLRTALAHPDAPATPAAGVPQSPGPKPAAASPTFEEDLQRTTEWHDLDQSQWDRVVGGYLDTLDISGLERFRTHLERMQSNCASHIESHKENEAKIAGGRFIEDQMSYRMAVLRTGQHDPDWLRTLREYEEWARWYGALHTVASQQIEARRRPPPPAPGPPPPPASASTGSAATLDALTGLKQLLEAQLASGAVRGERAVALRRTLEKLEALFAAKDRGEISADEAVLRCQQMARDIAPMFADPGSRQRTAHGSPLVREIDDYAGGLKTALTLELMPPPPPATAEAIAAILGDLREFQEKVAGVANDDELAQLEYSLLRPAAQARHQLAMTRHALIARPLWECGDYVPVVNAVAYSGGVDLYQKLAAVLAPRRLVVLNTRRLQNQGQVRWDELNACHVAAFDFRGAGSIDALAAANPKRAREVAAAAYELGLAFALGKPVVVMSDAGETMPFDLDLSPLQLDGSDDDDAMIRQSVDEAFYLPQRTGRDSSIAASLAFLDALTVGHEKRKAFEGMGWLDAALANDPAGFAAKASQIVAATPAPQWRLLRPAWPAAYPDARRKQCFHVMPFGPDWANEVRDVARQVCKGKGYRYRRGDEAEEGRIIHAIWDDLCRASVVLVDLSGANLNVLIELGMAHAIGRPVCAVRRSRTADVRPKNIEKLRVLSYDSAGQLKELLEQKLKA